LPPIAECDVKEVETTALKKALGPEIIKQAEADFDAPLESATPFVAAKAGNPNRADKRPRPAEQKQRPRDNERPETGRSKHKKRRRSDRSSGPRPSRPRPK